MPATLQPEHQGRYDSPRTLAEIVEAFAPLSPLIPGTRFAAYYESIRSFVAEGRPFADLNDHERPTLRHAMAECMEALDVFDALTAAPQVASWQREMRRLFDGDLVARASRHYIELPGCATQAAEVGEQTPLSDLISTPIERLRIGTDPVPQDAQNTEEAPRNAAFELWLACLFRRAGLAPEKAEPDWIVPTDVGRIAVAAKRIQSFSPLYARIEEADRQISDQVREGNAVAGIAAVDVTLAYDLHRKNWVIQREAESQELHTTLTMAMRENRERVQTALRDRPNVAAVLLQAKALVFVRETQRFLTARPILFAAMTQIGHPLNEWSRRFAAATVRPNP